jgi:RHS repeat-associated protein
VKKCYYHANNLYNVTAITDKNGVVVERYNYSPYGEATILDPTGLSRQPASSIQNPLLFTGRRLDAETGLMYYRARYYDVDLGRFVGRDPLGYVGRLLNTYTYVSDNPVDYTDPIGLMEIEFSRCDVCGPDVTDRLHSTIRDVAKRFSDLKKPEQKRVCGFGHLMQSWDIYFALLLEELAVKNSSCAKGKCAETVMYKTMCYDTWEINYILYGFIGKLCNKWKATQIATARLWKIHKYFSNEPEISSPTYEYTTGVSDWIEYGYGRFTMDGTEAVSIIDKLPRSPGRDHSAMWQCKPCLEPACTPLPPFSTSWPKWL